MRAFFIGLLVFGAAHAASAQQTSVDVKRLPIDLTKITRDLRQSAATESHNGLRIRYSIAVYGTAPQIELFTKDDNLQSAAVPYGAPTHRDFLESISRTIDGRGAGYRAPQIMDFNSLIQWLSDKTNRK